MKTIYTCIIIITSHYNFNTKTLLLYTFFFSYSWTLSKKIVSVITNYMILSGYIKTVSSELYFIMLEIYENIFSTYNCYICSTSIQMQCTLNTHG